MIDLLKICQLLETENCAIHNQKPISIVVNKEKIKIKTCCDNFKKELEKTSKTEIIKQTQVAIKGLFKK